MIKKPQEIVIKNVMVEENRDNVSIIYRKRKDGTIHCTGFEIKAYGDTPNIIDFKIKEMIKNSWNRFNEPYPKD